MATKEQKSEIAKDLESAIDLLDQMAVQRARTRGTVLRDEELKHNQQMRSAAIEYLLRAIVPF